MKHLLLIPSLIVFVWETLPAVVVPAPFFSDHAVVQAGLPLRVWGKADPAESVTVTFAGASATAKADDAGEWNVTLPSVRAGTRGVMVFKASNEIRANDIIAGEVWFCAGQSNMQMAVKAANDAEKEIAAADHPDIRQFFIPLSPSPEPRSALDLKPTRWQSANPETIGSFTAAGYFFAREIQRELKVPVGLVFAAWGGTPIQPWIPLDGLKLDPEFDSIMERKRAEIAAWPQRKLELDAQISNWEAEVAAAKAEGREPPAKPWQPGAPDSGHYMPGQLYNGMVHPATRFNIRGALWYQGEANAGGGQGGAAFYTRLQSLMVGSWRKAWNQGDFPFLFVQLPGWGNPGDKSAQSWAWFREGQEKALATTNTAMAVTIDIGDDTDIHPPNKQEAGRRLALLALDRVYQKPGVVSEGPRPKAFRREAEAVAIAFPADSGLRCKTGTTVTGFEVSQADGAFKTVEATMNGNIVRIDTAGIAKPNEIRYLWQNNPRPALFGGTGLPVPPFRHEFENPPVLSDKRAATRPNVLFIAIDDLRTEHGISGSASTPNLDRLGKSARVFSHHYAHVPTCGASRCALMRGRYPSDERHIRNEAIKSTSASWAAQSLPATFRGNGYRTLALGKITHYPGGLTGKDWAAGPEEIAGVWHRSWVPESPWKTPQAMMHGYANGIARRPGKSPPFEAFDGPDKAYPDAWVADEAVATLATLAKSPEPWFFGIGFFKPHLPFAAPKRFHDLHADDSNEMPAEAAAKPAWPSGWHGSGELLGAYASTPETNPLANPAAARRLRQAYAACMSHVDAQVGRVLDALESHSLDRNTIVVVWSDHGFLLGEHGIWGKHCLFEQALRSPLIIRTPGIAHPGITSKAIVETVDLHATLADLCGIQPPAGLDGRSLRPMLENPETPSMKPALGFWGGGQRTVRDDRWRLIVGSGGKRVELFDYLADPHETRNHAEENPEIVQSLKRLLK